jgi:PKD repeat protein
MNIVFAYKLNSYYWNFSRLLLLGFTLLLFSTHVFSGSLNLAWDASTSANVAGYKLYYGQTSNNFTSNVDVGNKTTFQVAGLTDGVKYFFAVKGYNSARTLESGYSNEVSAIVPTASVALTATFTASKTSGTSPLNVIFTPGTNQSGAVTKWQWSFPGASLTSVTNTTAAPVTVTYSTSTAKTYSVTLTVTGSNGSSVTTTKTNFITVAPPVVTPPPVVVTPPSVVSPPPPPVTSNSNLVAAYSFDEIGGATAADASGKASHGTIKEAVRITTVRDGKAVKALKFDGINDWVTVNDSASLDLSSGLSLEAWVYPQAIKSGSVLLKEQAGGAVYNLYPYEDADLPISSLNDGVGYRVISGTKQLPINQWTHLTSTYDGLNQRLYVNGVQVSSRAQKGLIKPSTGVLRIGGNSIWGEFFQGYIDEVRIYNRALTNAEIQKDSTTAISVSIPPQLVVGNKTLEPSADSNPQGMAEAFKTTPQKNGVVTAVQVYSDAGSKATELVAGIYSDNNGHPGTLLAQGKSTVLKAGATNTVPIPTTTLVAAKPYWIAILGSKGQIKFRNRMGSGVAPMETSTSSTLTTLPGQWITGSVYPNDGPMSVYGTGY